MKNFKFFVFILLSVVLFSRPTVVARAVSLDPNTGCNMNIKSGWNLVSLAELYCGLLKIDRMSSSEAADIFPVYLDLYAYSSGEYLYARLNKQDVKISRSLESAAEKYLNNLTRKVTSNEYNNYRDFEKKLGRDIENNDTQKIKEYAGRLNKEILTSIWVYNPGRDFNMSYTSKYQSDDEILAILAIRGLITDTNSSDLLDVIETNFLPGILRELDGYNGYLSFLKESVSGKIILDSGWNFLSYSRLLSDNNGVLDLSSGNCSITKTYVFDDSSKKWVSAGNVTRSMVGSGMVVYNSGGKCTLTPTNSILSRMKSVLGGGSSNTPPVLPN